nr:MAG TPA: hypothetical protein [Caudoviricetes sp.]
MLDYSIARNTLKNKYAPFYNCTFEFECAIITVHLNLNVL